MNIGLMRHLDYWLGLPLCYILSAFKRVFGFIPRRRMLPGQPRRVLFIKLSELGSIVLSYPLLSRVKARYPDAELFFVTFARNKGIFQVLGILPEENILYINDRSLGGFISDTLKAISKLRAGTIEIIFDLEFLSRFSAIFAYLAGADKIVGFHRYGFEGLYRGNFLTHRLQYNPLIHISKNYLAMAQVIQEDRKESPELARKIDEAEIIFPAYVSGDRARETLAAKLRSAGCPDTAGRLFLVNPGEGVLPVREWPLDYFISLCRKILSDAGNRVILVGTEGASYKAGLITRAINHPRCLDFSAQTSLEELFALFSLADTLISNDCGLSHLSMLTPVKKFIIFGPESPRVFAPLGQGVNIIYSHWPCSPCLSVFNHRVSFCRDNLCLKAITPEEVYGLISQPT